MHVRHPVPNLDIRVESFSRPFDLIAEGIATGIKLSAGLKANVLGMPDCAALALVCFSGIALLNRELPAVRAFKQGMGPVVIALLVATGWILASAHPASSWRLWAVTAATVLIVLRGKTHLLWLLGAGALLGGSGLV